MKSVLLLFVFSLVLGFSGHSQIHDHALGIRGLLGNYGLGGELSYQHGLSEKNRLELDLGFRRSHKNHYRSTFITGMYHWVWSLDEGFNLFAGIGGQIGFYNHKYDDDDGLVINAGGQLGIEYDFNTHGAPIQVGLDIRPMFGFLSYNPGFGYGAAFSARYTF